MVQLGTYANHAKLTLLKCYCLCMFMVMGGTDFARAMDLECLDGSQISQCSGAARICATTCVNIHPSGPCNSSTVIDHWFDLYVEAPGDLGFSFSGTSGLTGEYILVGPISEGGGASVRACKRRLAQALLRSFHYSYQDCRPDIISFSFK